MTFLYTHFQSLLLLINLSFCCTFVIPQKYVISELKFNVPEQQHEETPEFVARNKLVTIVIKMQKNSNSKWATHAAEQKKRRRKVSQKTAAINQRQIWNSNLKYCWKKNNKWTKKYLRAVSFTSAASAIRLQTIESIFHTQWVWFRLCTIYVSVLL